MLSRFRFVATLSLLSVIFPLSAAAQTPVALPYTMTTLAGQSPMTATAGTQCPGLPQGKVSADAYGDGCLAVNGIFTTAAYSGVVTDPYGNLYVSDDSVAGTTGVLHKINPATGIMTLVAGNNTVCSGALDSSGDGCVAATGTPALLVNKQRGVGIDPYGNILLSGYSDHLVHLICLNISPLCVNGTPSLSATTPIQIQIGNVGLVAGCAGSTSSNGITGTGTDNTPGYSIKSNPTLTTFQNGGTCTAALGEVQKPEAASADVYGNVYYADSAAFRWRVVLGPASYNGVSNPLYAVLQKNAAWTTVTTGYAYTISGYTGTATTKGSGCNGSGTATDAFGDGCLFTSSVTTSSAVQSGMGVDAAGNVIYTDPGRGGLRVFYVSDGTNFTSGTAGYIAGQRMKNAIIANIIAFTGWTSVTAPPTGFNYMLAGGGSTGGVSITPYLGNSRTALDTSILKLAISPQGHIFIGDKTRVLFFDINTGYIRILFTGSSNIAKGSFCSGSSGPKSLSAYSDGCPAANSLFTNSDGLSLAVDPQDNLYIYDGSQAVIRKVLAQGFTPQTYNTTPASQTQTFQVHLPESATASPSGATAAVTSSPDITVASGTNPTTPSCAQNGDKTVDCTVQVTTAPTQVGQRSAALTVTLPAGSWENASATINLNQMETGSVMVVDSASLGGTPITPVMNSIFTSITPAAVAVDGAGNVYAASGTSILESISGSTYTLTSSLTATPLQIAVDPTGNIFAVNSSIPTINELELTAAGAPATYTLTPVTYTPTSGTAAPQAIATDQFGNLYVADYQSGGSSVYRLSLSPITLQYQNQVTVASGLVNPVSLAVDSSGNVFVADKSAGNVYEYSPSSAAAYSLANTYPVTLPDAVAVDAGGNLYAQSGSDIYEIPFSGLSEIVVYSGLSNPVGLAVDGLGNVYSADASKTSITQIVRNNLTCNFGTETTAGSATCTGALTNAGNQLTTGSVAPSYFTLSGCGVVANEIEPLSAGESCALYVTMSGTSTIPLTFLPSASSVGSLTLTGTVQASTYNTTTAIAGPAPASPLYAASGTEATFTMTVAPASGSGYIGSSVPSGTPTAWVCQGSTACTYSAAYATFTPSTLSQIGSTTSSSATVLVTGLAAGTYNINASYPGGSSTGPIFNSSATSSGTSFTVGQVGTAVNSWTPSVTTQQVSAAIGTGVLNATATPAGVAGNFVYTATCTSGSCTQYTNTTIDASTYLPIGTYTLGVSFVSTDQTDYISSTGSSVNYAVTQASTTAAVGASTNVVASDGSGNYTSLTAALASLPITGGTLYLKPGTYTGQNAISYPNVSLRGLGGSPANVLLTGANGNFTLGSYPQSSGTAFGPGPAGKGGDEGSAVLDVSKNGYPSGSYSPAGFYAEYLTIQNTYDTDTVTTSTTTASSNGGTCISNPGGTAYTLQYLYNNNLSCGSQAQALYMNADQAILNNVNLISQQDTLYAGYQGTSGSNYVPSRQYVWKGMITGDVDFIYGDAALVMDHTNIFTTWHGLTAGSGSETITAQNKRAQNGSANDYLSGYVCNACTLMSQGTGMTKLYYGRPYGVYSTFVLLNSQVDQVNPGGWVGWDGASEYLSTSTYAEYNTQAYTDPAVGTAPYPSILFYPTTAAGGVIPTGGNIGAGVTGTLESSALQLTAAQATPYYPVNFLSTPVSTTGGYSGMPTTWNPVTALATAVNSFAPSSSAGSVGYGGSVTILGRPQTPGAGVVPTGTYAFYDNLNTNSACSVVAGNCSLLASGTLDASGEAYLTSTSLSQGIHYVTMVYGGDANFATSTTTTPYAITVVATLVNTATTLSVTNSSSTYGGTITGTATVTPASGSDYAVGTVTLSSGATALGSCTLAGTSNTCSFSLTNVAAGVQTMTASYTGGASLDGNETFGSSSSGGVAFTVNQAILHLTASNASVPVGGAMPTFGYTVTGYLNSDTGAVLSGSPTISTTAANTAVIGEYPISITTGTLAASNYTFTFTGGYLYVTGTSQAAAVATGDSRVVTEPVFPAVCQQLTAAITQVGDDIPASVDATVSNPDGARIQAALNSCSVSNPGQAVELSIDGAGHSAFLTGPLSMPSNVTLLVDPGVVLFFSRNAQDYDKVPGTHTCGNITNASATSSCKPLIDIPGASTNVGIMGYGKLDGRGGDPLINAIPPYQGYSWWGLSAAYASPNSQQNPRWIQMESGSSNITLYKITLRNAPLFHVATGGAVSNFTAWDIKIVTPTTSRNTDGIDPGNVTNVTITRSWISDGDDNVAVGAAGTTAPASNISVTNNHFFAGHGQSFGSYTGAGISNVLWDGNIAAGNGVANLGSASITGTADSNSTGIRIKSANDRGGLVTGIQYSNECLLDHKIDIQFTPYYSSGDSTNEFPNYKNILMQNIVFVNDNPIASAGTVEMTGEYNTNSGSPVINPLYVTLDNVTFPSALSSLVNSTSPVETTAIWGNGNSSGGTGQYAALTYGPGAVSTNFITAFGNLVSVPANNDTVTNNITASSLNPPSCSFTYIAPELTGPTGLPQTITQGQNATAVVILTPAVGGAAYPTGTVTLTDALTSSTYTVPLSGTTDTFFVSLTSLTAGTHTFTATYSGDTNYPLNGQAVYTTTAPYVITVNAGSLSSSSTSLGLPVSTSVTSSYGTAITATATVTGANPTGSVQFVVSGGGLTGSYIYATAALTSSSGTTSTASASINLPYDTIAYSITAVYSGDSVNAGSTSSAASLTVGAAATQTVLTANSASAAQGNPFILTATVTSTVGTPAAAPVTFAYSTTLLGAQTTLGTATLSNGVTTYYLNSLPVGSYYLFANYAGSGSYGASGSTGVPITVTAATNIVQLPSTPIALPYTMTTIAGGGAAVPSSGNMVCTGATNKYGDGCQATAIAFTASDDMRAVTADPFGNVYLSDISATRVRRITPNGVITTFAGGGSTCTPPASTSANGTGCTPTLASLTKPRGVGSDAAGNVYIADYTGNKVYVVKASDGLMYLVAGTGTASSTGDGGPATSATINTPRSAWGDSIGNIYIAETGGYRIRVVDTAGNIHTFAGTGTNTSTRDGAAATAATISNPQGVFVDPNLNVYVADSAGKIRVICVTCGTSSPLDSLLQAVGATTTLNSATNGYIYTIAGNGSAAAYTGTYPILSTSVSFAPQKLSMDNSGNLYISDSNGFVWFLDFHTGYLRAIAANGTICANKTDSLGDGCPATQASFGSNGGNGFGAGMDTQGNLYISDSTNGRIRKVITGLAFPSTAVNATTTQSALIHATTTLQNASWTPGEWSAITPLIINNGDGTYDWPFNFSFTPKVPGLRSAALTFNTISGSTAYLSLTGIGSGAGATLDPASQISFGTGLSVAGLATDNAGNVYVSDASSKKVLRFASSALTQGTSAAFTTLATLTAPGAVAVDSRGYVYAADTSTGKITQITPAGTVSTLPFTFTAPAGLAVDALNNLYVSDSSAQAVYQINPITGVERNLNLGTLVTPKGLTIDPSGNLLVADPGVPAIYRFNPSGTRTTVTTSATAPMAVLTDAAGNLLIADTADILAVPASSYSSAFMVASLAPSALAIDSAGNLYTGSNGGVLKLIRTQGYVQYAGPSAPAQAVSMLESGNQAMALTSVGQSDSTDYSLTATASTDCALSGGLPSALSIGGACAMTASYTPTTYVTTTDTVTLNGNPQNAALSTPSSIQLTLTGPAAAPASVTVLQATPSSPVYGQTITLKSITTSSGSLSMPLVPAGSVTIYIDSSTQLTGTVDPATGIATVSAPGLIAGNHQFYSTYTSSNGYTSSTSSTANLTISQATPSITWATPAAITYGTALSGTQLNATATGVTGASLPGTFTYSPLSGTVLTAGSQTLSVSFTPTDTTNYTTTTMSVQLQVNKANPTLAWATPAAISYGTALSGTQLNATATGVTGASLPGTFTYSPLSGTVLTVGSQTLSVSFTPTDTTDYTTPATATVQLQVNKANPTLAWVTPAAITYGTALSGTQLNASATGVTGASLPGTFTYSPLSGTVLTVGSQTLSVSFVPTDTTNYTTPATATVQLQVNKVASAISLVSSLNPILLQNPVTYTATVSSAAGKPTGTVTFQDGGVALTACTGVTVTTSTGLASCAVTYTATGTHSITVLYNGDTNFLSAGPSNTVSEAAIDINLGTALSGSGTGSSQTILPGGTATYSFPIAPSSGTSFPSAVTFTVTGMPTGATATLAPSAWALTSSNPWTWTLPANTTLTGNTLLSIQVPQTTASAQPAGGAGGNLASRLAPFSLALLLLPFVGRLRRTGKRLGRILPILLLLGAGMAAMAGLSGCGGNNGFFAQAQRSYTMTVTVASGSLSHTSTITLTVE